jgi:hypothetical protein
MGKKEEKKGQKTSPIFGSRVGELKEVRIEREEDLRRKSLGSFSNMIPSRYI